MNNCRISNSSRPPVVIGTGLVALDVVIADDPDADPLLCVGGTCGNVLTALAFLGWKSYPIARLRNDAASKRVIEDLHHWGVQLDFISITECGSTPVVVQHIRKNNNGERSHSFSRKCPACGSWLPWYKAIKAATVPELSIRLPEADVFYFDRTSRGAITLAKNARMSGAIVMFEPSSESDPTLLTEALDTAHIVKVASDRLRSNETFLHAKSPLLLIETLGADGLRFSIKPARGRRVWKTLPALHIDHFRDASGAGDWCTTGIINYLGPIGPDKLAKASLDTILDAVIKGQAMASWACQYDGARGGMYTSSKEEFQNAVYDILKGKKNPPDNRPVNRPYNCEENIWCSCLITK